MDMESPVTFGEWLRLSRNQLRLTRGEFADRVGCSVSTLRKIEEGERRPSIQIAELLANCLNLPPTDHPTFVKVARGELSVDRLAPITERMLKQVEYPAAATLRLNLPGSPNPLIGRQRDVNELIQLLQDEHCRLLTLVGPGGIGKTRLAVEAAAQAQASFPDGVYFVPLAQANSSSYIVPLIADAIGFAFQRESYVDPKLQLFDYLQEKQALLLLDNLEHLLDESGVQLFSDLLEYSLRVKLLVTSRESSGLSNEWVFEVQGLLVPKNGNIEENAPGTSVELFLQRARRAQVMFNPAAEDYPVIIRICRLVDGMPLGIELAAAWVRTLSCAEIAREIERGLEFLSTSARDLPPRHRSLRAVFDHSWKLLTEEERAVLLRIAVFQGGFQRKAAEAVAGASLSVLSAFVAKSIIQRSHADRYSLHELVREFSLKHLADRAEEKAEAEARHARYYLTSFCRESERLQGLAQQAALAHLTLEIDNIRSAWDWAVSHAEFSLIEQTLRSFATFFDNRGWFQEGLDFLARACGALQAAMATSPPGKEEMLALGHIYACQGLLSFRLAQNAQAQSILERSIEVLRPLDEPGVLVEALTFLGIVMALSGDYERALLLLDEGLELAEQVGDRWFAALCLTEQIGTGLMVGKSENDYERLRLVVADWRAIGDPRFTAFGLNFLSLSAFTLGLYDEARTALEESIVLNSSVGDRWGLGSTYRGLGLVAQAQGEHVQALVLFHESQEIFTELGARWDVARVLADMGHSEFALGNDAAAERRWYEALRLSIETRATLCGLEALVGVANLQAKRGHSDAALELLSVVMNHPASAQETRNRAAQLRAELAARMTPTEIELAERRAWARTFASIAEDILGQSGIA